MNSIQKELLQFKDFVSMCCENPDFAYRDWFLSDHLIIVERIAMELCDIYSEVDRNLIFALVWFHDIGKILDQENEHETAKKVGVEKLRQFGLSEDFINRVVSIWERMELKNEIDISKESIEVQIISSADGASHLTGKFYATYFQNKKSIEENEIDLRKKIEKDWERKITLPEVKSAFFVRYKNALELIGEYPNRFLV